MPSDTLWNHADHYLHILKTTKYLIKLDSDSNRGPITTLQRYLYIYEKSGCPVMTGLWATSRRLSVETTECASFGKHKDSDSQRVMT